MNGGGPGSGIWKSTDGGETWTRLKGSGFPTGRSAASRSTSTASGRTSSTRPSKGRRCRARSWRGWRRRGGGGGEEGPGGRPLRRGRLAAGAAAAARVNSAPTGLYRSDDAGATWRKVTTRTRGRCTSARSASIRTTPRRLPGRRGPAPDARRRQDVRYRRPPRGRIRDTTPSGSIPANRITC